MAKKVILKDLNNVEILPITRGELIIDSSGKLAFHSNEFLATNSLPGLMSKEDKSKIDKISTSTLEISNLLTAGKKIATISVGSTSYNILAPATYAWSEITDRPTKLSQFTDDVVVGKYLPLSGGTIVGTAVNPLNITTTNETEVGIYFNQNNTSRTWVGYSASEGSGIYDVATKSTLGITIGGVPHFNNKTILHSGNVGDYVVILGLYPTNGGDYNYALNTGIYRVTYDVTDLPSTSRGNIVFHGNYDDNAAAQLFLNTDANEFSYRRKRGRIWYDWKTIAFTDSDITGNAATASLASKAVQLCTKPSGLIYAYASEASSYITLGRNNYVAYLDGSSVTLRYGSSLARGFILNSSGNVTIGGSDLAGTNVKLYVDGNVKATSFIGNLDGTYINKLTGYSKATTASDLVETDTLNIALGKLEYKADTAYSWYRSITLDDTDDIINKWDEVVDFVNGLEVDLTEEFVTRKTAQVITGQKIFNTSSNVTPLIISRNTNTTESLAIGVNDEQALFVYNNDEKANAFVFKLINNDIENSDGSNANTSQVTFVGSASGSSITADILAGKLNNTLTFSAGTFSTKTYNNGLAVTINVPTHTSHLTNDLGFVTGGPYLPLIGGTISGTLQIKRNASAIQYLYSDGTVYGWLGFSAKGTPTVWMSDGSTKYTILHAGNYNSYAPTLTGGGASGTWDIGLKGKSITSAEELDALIDKTFLVSYLSGGVVEGFSDGIILSTGVNGKYGHLIYLDDNTESFKHRSKNGTGSVWYPWRVILDSNNYTNYINSTNFPGLAGVRSVTINGDYLRVNTNGTNDDLTIPYADSASKLTTVSKTAWGKTYWTSGGIPTSISGDMNAVGNISISATGNKDYFISFLYDSTPTYSWRLGYLGSGYGDTNYFVIQSSKSSGGTWHNVLLLGNEHLNALFSANVTSTGFIKSGSSSAYVLTGDGGHRAISDFLLKSELANLELSNNLTTITKSLTVTADWMDTGIKHKDLDSGTYIVQVYVSGSENGIGNMFYCYWSGVMSWYNNNTNDSESDEILLHRSGHAYGNTIYLRTIMTANSDGRHLRLLIAANKTLSAAYTYTFKFKRVI